MILVQILIQIPLVKKSICRNSPTPTVELVFRSLLYLNNYKCVICGLIVRDCVDLDCINNKVHDVNPFMDEPIYCKICLEQYLKKNDGRCPMNSKHLNLKYSAVGSLCRRVLSATVNCTNGNHVDDNSYDDLEGNQVQDTQNIINVNICKCDWTESLSQYLNDHIGKRKCKFLTNNKENCLIIPVISK